MTMVHHDLMASLGLVLLLTIAATTPTDAFPTIISTNNERPSASISSGDISRSKKTSLNNMLREFADGGNYNDPYYRRQQQTGASATNWRKNQGYNLSKPTPPELGGSYSSIRDTETNPYYDPGWAQSVRRDNPASTQNYSSNSMYNGYNDPYSADMYGGSRSYQYPSTYPGMTTPRRTDKVYTNPTNPYYDPVWSQSYDTEKYGMVRNDDPIRESEHMDYYRMGYDRKMFNDYYGGMGGGGYGMGGGMGGGMRGGGPMYAISPSKGRGSGRGGGAVLNGNSLMRNQKTHRNKLSALQMSYFDGPMMDWDGPFFDGPMGGMPPPGPGYGRGMGPGARVGNYGSANEMNQNYQRRGGSGFRRGGGPGGGAMRGGPGAYGGTDPFMPGPEMSLRDSQVAWGSNNGGPPPFGRDNAMGRMSLKDMAARSSKSYNAEVINKMNNRGRAGQPFPGGGGGGGMGSQTTGGRAGMGSQTTGGRAASSPTSTSSQYVPLSNGYGRPPVLDPYGRQPVMDRGGDGPLSAVYGPQGQRGQAVMDRSPPLNVGPPPPQTQTPIIDTSAVRMGEVPLTIQAARSVRPSVVLVTSKGVRKENSQGSGFVVAFDDTAAMDDDDDDEMKDRVYILTSAHVAPPGWKVSVTFPGDPDKQYPATVVGRKLNSDLALLCVETIADEDEDYPFPPPLVLTAEDVSTDTSGGTSDGRVPTSEIGSPVYAFGYPMGVEGPTMTCGILSATTNGINYMDAPTGEEPSEISKSRPFEKTAFVITDAAMAGGMSGGPLVNNEGIVLGINALVRPDLRALGNYAVSALECETFLEKLEDKRSKDARKSGATKRVSSRTSVVNSSDDDDTSDRGQTQQQSSAAVADEGVAGYRVMLYGYSTDKADATRTIRRVAGLDELRAENAMRSTSSFGAGVVDEFYVAESGNRERAVKAARKSADDLLEKLKAEGMMAEVEPLNLLK